MTGARRAGLVLAIALATAPIDAAEAAATPPNLPEAMLVAKAALDQDGLFLRDDAAAAEALQSQWQAVRYWTADRLRTHPQGTPGAVAAALKAETGFDVSVLRLDPRSLLFAVTDDARGDAFILRRGEAGGWTTAWAVEAPGLAAAAAFPLIEAWSPTRAGASCRTHRAPIDSGRCGPLTARIAALRPEADASPRFVLNGVYAQEAGATQGQLVSVWRWTGVSAAPLLARTFTFMADQARPIADTHGGGLRVGSKQSWREMFACGACEGRQSTTETRLDGHGAAWAPTVSLTPEIDAVDALYDAVVRGRPTQDVASAAAAAAARAQVASIRAEAPLKPGDDPGLVLGMISNWKLEGAGAARTLCLDTDAGRARRFSLARIGETWRVMASSRAPDGACGGAGAHT